MSGLSEFLLARIAEDEERGHRLVAEWFDVGNACQSCGTDGARVLSECDAKRRLVVLHRPSPDNDAEFDPYCVGCWEAGGEDGAPSYPCPTARLLALPYASHPDYDEGWRP